MPQSKTNYRFVPKTYGWGFVPVTRQGRLWTLLLLVLIIAAAFRNGIILFVPYSYDVTIQQTISFLLDLFLIVFANARRMERKCSAPLRWRWGRKD